MKKIIIVGLTSLLCLTSCTQEKEPLAKAPPLVQETKSVQLDANDPMYQALFNKITFKFDSDDGRYFTGDMDDHIGLANADLLGQLKRVKNFIDEGDFQKAKKYMKDIPDTNAYVSEIKINYMIPILMSENNYKDALRVVLEKMNYENTADKRFQSDLAYLQRYMYLNNGWDHSMAVIDDLRVEYPDHDLSYVWFAISVKNYYDVYTNGIALPFSSDSDDYQLLSQIIEDHGDDPMLDHAYYFMGQYDTVIENYPQSPIIDRAYYGRAYHHYRVINPHWWYSDDEPYVAKDLTEVTGAFQDYLKHFSASVFSEYAVGKLMYVYNDYYRHTGDYSYHFDLMAYIIDNVPSYIEKRQELLEQISRSLQYNFEGTPHFIEPNKNLTAYLKSVETIETGHSSILIGLANNAFNYDNLALAERYFEASRLYNYGYYSYGYYGPSDIDRNRYKILLYRPSVFDLQNKDLLFRFANTLKNEGEEALALVYYKKLEAFNLNQDEMSQLYMYKAYCYRQNKMYEDMYASHEYIASNYPFAEYADDAYAEMGVYHLLYLHDTKKAREIFRDVIDKYAGRNTVNDAYNWIAWSYLQDEDYTSALEAYKTLQVKFPSNRFGINALDNIEKITQDYVQP